LTVLGIDSLCVSSSSSSSPRDGCIQTALVYEVLLGSQLPRDVLMYIWDLCNKATPGQLVKEELFLILAMISVAQVNELTYVLYVCMFMNNCC